MEQLFLQVSPNMTKEKLEDRIKQLETEREQVRATLLAYEGALQDCKYWLTSLQEAETDKPSKKEVDGGKPSSKSSK